MRIAWPLIGASPGTGFVISPESKTAWLWYQDAYTGIEKATHRWAFKALLMLSTEFAKIGFELGNSEIARVHSRSWRRRAFPFVP